MNNKMESFSFQGVNGAFSELAGKKIYPNAKSIPCKTFEEMFESVRQNKAQIAIVPIENSSAGRIADTQRLIPNSKLKIVVEFFLEIEHCLLGERKGRSLELLHSKNYFNKIMHKLAKLTALMIVYT